MSALDIANAEQIALDAWNAVMTVKNDAEPGTERHKVIEAINSNINTPHYAFQNILSILASSYLEGGGADTPKEMVEFFITEWCATSHYTRYYITNNEDNLEMMEDIFKAWWATFKASDFA